MLFSECRGVVEQRSESRSEHLVSFISVAPVVVGICRSNNAMPVNPATTNAVTPTASS
jgi:hypothetical protein